MKNRIAIIAVSEEGRPIADRLSKQLSAAVPHIL